MQVGTHFTCPSFQNRRRSTAHHWHHQLQYFLGAAQVHDFSEERCQALLENQPIFVLRSRGLLSRPVVGK